MKRDYTLSRAAIIDLDDIWNHTADQWSASQANTYYKLIFKEIKRLSANPLMGKAIEELETNHRSWIVQSHMIVYKLEGDVIYIARILHQRMDLENEIDLL